MSRLNTSFVLGYHGCERETGEKVVAGNANLRRSDNDYDWLGPGIYFWEGDPARALEWARSRREIREPFVLGAVIVFGNYLDLVSRENLDLLKKAYRWLSVSSIVHGPPLPENEMAKPGKSARGMRRDLDCAVIRTLHAMIDAKTSRYGMSTIPAFDSVRCLFVEGEPLYPGSGFIEKTHTQIAVVNEACIKGHFIPAAETSTA